ncbi:uncharacterized protein LOC126987607 [Eriocheir sinensis]|uniref:uncharacterized protein LOC126987607 n=1 Tax=Eriocheir sinensis TaxID=95602 RepID=UPI0021CAA798|nr:uncharacterized protein LOC126987607 [Eriocheir sinensis]XP_050700686.1 uncharacterized protein LOC126987607 [Eriocheir sinensis]
MAGNCGWSLSEDAVLHIFVVYCCFFCIVGIICNVVALWCVARCHRTITPVKVILGAIFSCTLLICLVELPFMAHVFLADLRCDEEVPKTVEDGVIITCVIINNMELFYISIMALLRARAVWAPGRGPVKLRTAVALVVGVGLYSLFMLMVIHVTIWTQDLHIRSDNVLEIAYCVVHYFLPVLLTLVCYLSTIVAVRRNQRNLPSGQPTAAVDEVTRAMLAVFLSNLVSVLPFSIYAILPLDTDILTTGIMNMLYYTHLFVDPLVFVCFIRHHRRRVLHGLKLCLGRPPGEEDGSTLESQVTKSPSALCVPTRGEVKPQ